MQIHKRTETIISIVFKHELLSGHVTLNTL